MLRLVLVTTRQSGLPFLPGYTAETSEQVLAQVPAEGEEVVLRLDAERQDYCFYAGPDEDRLSPVYLHADGKLINPEEVGGMVGTVMGMFATANGAESDNAASFAWFSYVPKAE